MLTENGYVSKGVHNGIIYATNEFGWDFYYSTKSGKNALSGRGVARMLECDNKTISNAQRKLTKKGENMNAFMEAEMLTGQGVQAVNLIFEDGLNLILQEIITNKRIKEKTRQKALEVQGKFVQAGLRLMAMLEIAPEVVAKEAIRRIDNPEAARQVARESIEHADYIESYHDVHGLGRDRGWQSYDHAMLNTHNNRICGLPQRGGRPNMNRHQRQNLTVAQIFESRSLEKTKLNGSDSREEAQTAGTNALNLLNQ